jgi:hypothetical protein
MSEHPSNKDIKTLLEKRSNLYSALNASTYLIMFLLKTQDTSKFTPESIEELKTLSERWMQSQLLVDPSIKELLTNQA